MTTGRINQVTIILEKRKANEKEHVPSQTFPFLSPIETKPLNRCSAKTIVSHGKPDKKSPLIENKSFFTHDSYFPISMAMVESPCRLNRSMFKRLSEPNHETRKSLGKLNQSFMFFLTNTHIKSNSSRILRIESPTFEKAD